MFIHRKVTTESGSSYYIRQHPDCGRMYVSRIAAVDAPLQEPISNRLVDVEYSDIGKYGTPDIGEKMLIRFADGVEPGTLITTKVTSILTTRYEDDGTSSTYQHVV